jgi:diadenosine tetraphosphate (Ap4A) HIT family hydrolase
MAETWDDGRTMTQELHPGGVTLAPETIIERGDLWTVALNRNQNLLGKVMLVLNRPLEQVILLREDEWADLHRQMRRFTLALTAAFQPDHFNYAFLQNQDRQVHLHVIPRYAASRTIAGETFADPDYPDHYHVPATPRMLSKEQLVTLAETIRRALPA